MAKKKRFSRSKKTKLPLTVALPLAVDGAFLYSQVKDGKFSEAEQKYTTFYFTGINQTTGQVDVGRLMLTYGKYVAGGLIHKYVGKRVNGYLDRANVPLIRL